MSDGLENEEKTVELKDKFFHEVKELIVTILIFLPVWFFFSLFVYELRSIPSESMVPNLQVGDRVAVSKFAYGYSKHSVPLGLGKYLPLGDGRLFASQPKRGDVVVFRHPHADKVMIKRLIGLPGDTVQMAGVRVVINGKPLEQETQREVRYHEARRGLSSRLLSSPHTSRGCTACRRRRSRRRSRSRA